MVLVSVSTVIPTTKGFSQDKDTLCGRCVQDTVVGVYKELCVVGVYKEICVVGVYKSRCVVEFSGIMLYNYPSYRSVFCFNKVQNSLHFRFFLLCHKAEKHLPCRAHRPI